LPPRHLRQVEGEQEDFLALMLPAETFEHGEPVSSQATASPSIKHERTLSPDAAPTMEGKMCRPVAAIARQQPDASAVSAPHQPVAVVLDLVHPDAAESGGARRTAPCGSPTMPKHEGWCGGSRADTTGCADWTDPSALFPLSCYY